MPSKSLLVLWTMLMSTVPSKPGLKITIHNTSALRGETLIYLQNDRKRVEERRQVPQPLRRRGPFVYVPGSPVVTITRCDLDQMFVLILDALEDMLMLIPGARARLEARAAAQPE